MSSALEWVTKGRAMAPPARVCRIGVSTSTNPSSMKVRRMDASVLKRTSNTRRESGFASRSTSRWR